MPETVLFELSQVSYAYSPDRMVLQEIDLRIGQGEAIVLLGANGCGKSTLQKLLAGLIFPNTGRFTAFDRIVSRKVMNDKHFAAAYRRKIGFLFQNSEVQLFCTNVLAEVMFGLEAMGVPYEEARDKAWSILEFAGIAHLADRVPHHLSGGEKKKVAVAAVLAVNPEVLIMDEPTNGLDPKTQRWMIELLSELNEHNKTMIIATHHLDLAPEIAKRVIVMSEAHTIIADGNASDILENRELLLSANLIDDRYHVHMHSHNGYPHLHR